MNTSKQKFFKLVSDNPGWDFVGNFKLWFILSTVAIVGTFVLLMTKGLNYSVDFKGGTQIHVKFSEMKTAQDVRAALEGAGLPEAVVQEYGEKGSNEFLIRVQPQEMNLKQYQPEMETALSVLQGGQPKLRLAEERVYAIFNAIQDPEKIKTALSDLKGIRVDSVSPFGNTDKNEYLILFSGTASKIRNAFETSIGKNKFEILQVEQVGAKVGKELRLQAIGAILISILLILVYVWFRFDLEFAPGAVIALAHDALIVLGVFSLFQLQFDLSIVAAVLTIIGFSINDTIVIYDRVRENKEKNKTTSLKELINLSVNESLGRTVITSGTLFLSIVALYVFGGPINRNFALAFLVGTISGVYSTVYIASPLTIYFSKWLKQKR